MSVDLQMFLLLAAVVALAAVLATVRCVFFPRQYRAPGTDAPMGRRLANFLEY